MKNSIIVLLSLICLSCSSPLSDIAISDPGLISPHIKVEFSNTETGIHSMINACLNDKNGAYIELLEGKVTLNGELMSDQMNCYSSSAKVDPLKEYKIEVTLADSMVYLSTVTSPAFFEKVIIPNKIGQGESFDVEWADNSDNETLVTFEVKDSSNNWIKLFDNEVDYYNAFIDDLDYPDYPITEGKLTLTRIEKGKLADGFNGGSIAAKVTYERLIKIKKNAL